jgi:PAS domain S-box-containing protein
LDGKITTWNRGAERLYGYTSQEIVGQSITIIVPPDRKDEAPEILQKISRGESLDQYETVRRTKDGQQIHVCLTISPIKNAEGRIIGASTIARDITERKRADEALRKSEENFRSLFDHMLGGFAHCRMHFEQDQPVDFTYLNVNDAFETLTGLKNVTGKRVSECIPGIREANPEVFEIYGRVALTGKPERFETYVDPLKKWFSLSVYSPQKEHFVAVFDDITVRKRAEEELCHRTVQLEAANREMETFSHSVFHDLKGPLRAIEGFSRMLMSEHAGQLDAEGLRLLSVITDNTKLMHLLIDDLKALSRLGRVQIKKSIINLDAMTNLVFSRLRAQAPGRDLRLTIGDLPSALGDQSLLYQVLENLLANAIKFTKSRKTAAIEVGGKDRKRNHLYVRTTALALISVMPTKFTASFNAFTAAREYEGAAWLAIVKRIIERHGGRVWAEGTVNEGATFYFSLPKNGVRVAS